MLQVPAILFCDGGPRKAILSIHCVCRTAAKLGLCPCFASTLLWSSPVSHERYSRFPRRCARTQEGAPVVLLHLFARGHRISDPRQIQMLSLRKF